VDVRPATEGDFPEMHAVLAAAEGGVRHGHGFAWEPPPLEAFEAMHRHILGTGPQRVWVAEENRHVVAFAASWMRDGTWFLSDLFVRPEAQGRGLGTILLDRVWDAEATRRITLTTAIQPISNTMYARRGLVPATPTLKLEGVPQSIAPEGLEPSAGSPEALAAVDLAAYGFDRTLDHAFWGRSLVRTVWLQAGEPVAYSYARGGRIGPVAGLDPSAGAAALAAELARAGREVSVDVPGTARELVDAAVASGLRFGALPGLVLVSPEAEPPRAVALSGFWLF
jgi:GNAT superfamily N-acetyltransferase